MAFPVRAVNRPAVLDGQTNGQLSPSVLVDTPVPYAVWPCRLVTPAARSWRALAAAALKDGHSLKPSGPSDSYRPYEVQERIFLQRFTTTPIGSRPKRTWRGKTWYLKPGFALAALPGESNHGLGLAVDVGEETDGDTGTESVDQLTIDWLVANEERFGFSHEVQSEPWHVRYFAGDDIPRAVLDHERTTPDSPSEEDHMLIVIAPTTGKQYLLFAGKLVYIAGPAGLPPGVPTWQPDATTWANVAKAYGPGVGG